MVLGTALVLVLAFDGGGYHPVLRGQAGILVWWVLAVGCAAGLLPFRVPGRLALACGALFALFVGWVALSLIWTESVERTMADLARLATLLGVFLIALATRSRHGVRRMAGAVGVAITTVAAVALVVRLFPDLYPGAVENVALLPTSGNRLGFPLNYWNGLGALVGMGLPLMLFTATSTRSRWVRAVSASALPLLVLVVYLTYSRSAIAAAAIALLLFYALCSDRLSRLPILALSALGSAILIWLAASLEFVSEGPLSRTGDAAEGAWMLAATLVVCGVVGLANAAMAARPPVLRRPPRVSPGVLLGGGVALLGVLVVSALALDAPGRVDRAWEDFKAPAAVEASGPERLQSFSGNNRYQFWAAAVEQNGTRPLTGRGSGTFEFWSNRSEETTGFVRDAHSLYLETLGELGLVGFLLLAAFLLTLLIGGWVRVRATSERRRPQMAAVFASCAIPVVTAGVDWTWELPVVPVAFLLLASALVTAGDSGERLEAGSNRRRAVRISVPVLAVAAIVVIAIPTASTALVEESRVAASDGDLARALELADDAAAVEPAASTPHLQRALVLEAAGLPDAGLESARDATAREPTNWRPWLIRARLEAATGRVAQAVESFREARRLNPKSPLLSPG